MFYDSNAIQTLKQRVGMAQPIPPSAIVLSADNVITTSGRKFRAFSSYATAEKMAALSTNAEKSNVSLQALIEEMKEQAVHTVLTRIYDANLLANQVDNGLGYPVTLQNTDYSPIIISRANVFDDCYGYQFAVDVINELMTAERSNGVERAAKEGYVNLKIELEGVNENSGNAFTGKGLEYRLNKAYQNAIAILFPRPKAGLVDRTYLW